MKNLIKVPAVALVALTLLISSVGSSNAFTLDPLIPLPDTSGVVEVKIDLTITGFSRNFCSGNGSVTVKNIGTQTTKPTYINLKVYGSSRTPAIAYKKVPSLKPNQTVTVTGFPHPSPKFKDKKFLIAVDWFKDKKINLNKESNERNNAEVIRCIY